MRYVLARIDQNNRDEAYRIYITDALKALGGFDRRYVDLLNYKPPKEETRTPDEIVNRIRGRINELI